MSVSNNYNHTLYASYIGYVVQSIVINFMPLLYVRFNEHYNIPFSKISLLITVIFGIQLLVDLLSPPIIDRIGYRLSAVLANAFATVGLVLLAILPDLFSDPYTGILLALVFSSIGGGLTEVVISPIVEACPNDNKKAHMSLLHSFYCWGHVFVVLLSVGFFALFGIENWKYLSLILALIPFVDVFYFSFVPITSLDEAVYESTGERSVSTGKLVKNNLFWLMVLLIFCAGACEMAVGQWASALAEQGLKVSKTIGDLAGPLTFAVLMGSARVFYSKFGSKMQIEKYMLICGLVCLGGVLLIALSPFPVLSLAGCAVCGWAVGVMWPGTYSLASSEIKGASTAMFAMLALFGDLGCTAGPSLVGMISESVGNDLQLGILFSSIFPLLMIFGSVACLKRKK